MNDIIYADVPKDLMKIKTKPELDMKIMMNHIFCN